MRWIYSDGGRKAAGKRGDARDCVVRAMAIATGMDYAEVYADLFDRSREYATTRRTRNAKIMRKHENEQSPRTGVVSDVYKPYLAKLGWDWTPTMGIGTGCRVHLREDELPRGILIARLSLHLCAVADGVIFDTHDPSRDGMRAVYGYWIKGKLT